jgi:hypothetical protein
VGRGLAGWCALMRGGWTRLQVQVQADPRGDIGERPRLPDLRRPRPHAHRYDSLMRHRVIVLCRARAPLAWHALIVNPEPPARALLSRHGLHGEAEHTANTQPRPFSPGLSAWFQPPPQSTRGRVGWADERRCGAFCNQVEKFQRSFKMQAILGGSEEIMCDFAMRQAMRHFGKAASEPGVRPARL